MFEKRINEVIDSVLRNQDHELTETTRRLIILELNDLVEEVREEAKQEGMESELTEDEKENLREKVHGLMGEEMYYCSRDGSAWGYGTMGLDDFTIARDDSDIIEDFVTTYENFTTGRISNA